MQDWYVRYALQSAEGISEVASVGGFVQEYQIDVDPDAMRAYRVTLDEIFNAVRMSNVDVGARTIEVNKVEYVIRGLGFIKTVRISKSRSSRRSKTFPFASRTWRRSSSDRRCGEERSTRRGPTPWAASSSCAMASTPWKRSRISRPRSPRSRPDCPRRSTSTSRPSIARRSRRSPPSTASTAFDGGGSTDEGWLDWLNGTPATSGPNGSRPASSPSCPFYDRTGLIYETLGTLNTALVEEILVTIIVVIVMVMHLRSSFLISALLPLAVLMCFIGMKTFGVDANVVALSGIAIAIGTMVDMGIIVCENILKHLDEADPAESRLEVIYRASSEVASAVLTAVSTTVISFLPVFTMIGAEGKLFRPLAFTKTFALIASVIVALTIIPPVAHLLFASPGRHGQGCAHGLSVGLIVAGVAVGVMLAWWAGAILIWSGSVSTGRAAASRQRRSGAPSSARTPWPWPSSGSSWRVTGSRWASSRA